MIDANQLAEILNDCGVNAFLAAHDYSAQSWDIFREKIAQRLLRQLDAKITERG